MACRPFFMPPGAALTCVIAHSFASAATSSSLLHHRTSSLATLSCCHLRILSRTPVRHRLHTGRGSHGLPIPFVTDARVWLAG
jgi:hypothetical protein